MAKPRGYDEKKWDALPQFLLERVYLEDRTLGSIYNSQGGIVCKTLELPDKQNQRSISCIPEGEYLITVSGPVIKDDPNTEIDESGGRHPRPYSHYIVHEVPGRSGILIHRGYDPSWSQGCILVSTGFASVKSHAPTLERDSGEKLQWMIDNLPKTFRLLIEKK